MDPLPQWVEDALDEHDAFDPTDPIPGWEIAWVWREIESSDLDWPDEFLRRSA